jgi:hypothetical protein
MSADGETAEARPCGWGFACERVVKGQTKTTHPAHLI